jgi:hypothetical protein
MVAIESRATSTPISTGQVRQSSGRLQLIADPRYDTPPASSLVLGAGGFVGTTGIARRRRANQLSRRSRNDIAHTGGARRRDEHTVRLVARDATAVVEFVVLRGAGPHAALTPPGPLHGAVPLISSSGVGRMGHNPARASQWRRRRTPPLWCTDGTGQADPSHLRLRRT